MSVFYHFQTSINLKVLYLHANQIEDIQEVSKLGKLCLLKNLTLHGNSLENTKGYRITVSTYLPTLRHLDFNALTKADKSIVKLNK
jgi:Leucine-rich repeat (LRR) protein